MTSDISPHTDSLLRHDEDWSSGWKIGDNRRELEANIDEKAVGWMLC